MSPSPKLITTAGRAAPKAAKQSARDLPKNYTVHEPGSKGYNGTYENIARTGGGQPAAEKLHEDWRTLAGRSNTNEATRERYAAEDRRFGRQAYGIAGGSIAAGIAGGGALAGYGSHRAKRIRSGRALPVSTRKYPVRKLLEPSMPFVRQARSAKGVHDITSMPKKQSREQRFAQWASQMKVAEPMVYGGMTAGLGALAVGAQVGGNRMKRASRQRRGQLRRATPVTKSRAGAAYVAAQRAAAVPKHVVTQHPSQVAGTVAALAGGGAIASQAPALERRRTPKQRAAVDYAAGGTAGAAAAEGAWLREGFDLRAKGRARERKRPPGMSRTKHEKIMRAHSREQGVPWMTKPDKAHQPAFFQNYPEGLPATKAKRALGAMSGHTGAVRQAKLLGAAGALGMTGVAVGRGVNRQVSKTLYQRDERVSPFRLAGLVAGGTLAAYGLGHSGLVGRALARGVRISTRNGNEAAVEALTRAQAARNSIRIGMQPGEAALRRIRAVDSAVRKVPLPMRGEVALVAGTMLGMQSTPIRGTHYTQVSAPVTGFGRRW